MIIELKSSVASEKAKLLAEQAQSFHITYQGKQLLISSSSVNTIPKELIEFSEQNFKFENDMQLSSLAFSNKRSVIVGDTVIGGDTNNCLIMSGPCSVESEEQIMESAKFMSEQGVKVLRAGCYKPRTSPYSFQGLGHEGLILLRKAADKYGLSIVTEVKDASHVQEVIELSDMIQIGTKAMYDQGILKACGKTDKPILLKRGFSATLQEFVQAAEFILSGGNPNVILCERGIRTFETKTRFTLDLCGVAYLQEHCNLPIVIDPSHAMGYSYGVPALAKAAVAIGCDGLLIESHPTPEKALSDASQQLNHNEFQSLLPDLKLIAKAVQKELI